MKFDPLLFTKFIQEKFNVWNYDNGGRESLSDYSRFLGVNQQVINSWWNGKLKKRPSAEQYEVLIRHYGIIVYDVLALPRPENIPLSVLPRVLRERVEAYLVDVAETLKRESIDPESTRAETVAREILVKHGFTDITNK